MKKGRYIQLHCYKKCPFVFNLLLLLVLLKSEMKLWKVFSYSVRYESHLIDEALTVCGFPQRWSAQWGSGSSSSRSGDGVSSTEPRAPSLSRCRPAHWMPPGDPTPCLTRKKNHTWSCYSNLWGKGRVEDFILLFWDFANKIVNLQEKSCKFLTMTSSIYENKVLLLHEKSWNLKLYYKTSGVHTCITNVTLFSEI